MLDQSQLVYNQIIDYNYFFATTFYALLIILITNVLVLSHKYSTLDICVKAVLTLLLIRALYEDFIQLFAINQQYNNMQWAHVKYELADADFLTLGV